MIPKILFDCWMNIPLLFKNFSRREWKYGWRLDVFDIKHYWLRYEFAPFWGQIHAHVVAICGDYSFNVAMHRLKENKVEQAQCLQAWSRKAYSYTAKVEQNFDELNIGKEDSSFAEQFSDVADVSVDG
jgi:hypothetical protein